MALNASASRPVSSSESARRRNANFPRATACVPRMNVSMRRLSERAVKNSSARLRRMAEPAATAAVMRTSSLVRSASSASRSIHLRASSWTTRADAITSSSSTPTSSGLRSVSAEARSTKRARWPFSRSSAARSLGSKRPASSRATSSSIALRISLNFPRYCGSRLTACLRANSSARSSRAMTPLSMRNSTSCRVLSSRFLMDSMRKRSAPYAVTSRSGKSARAEPRPKRVESLTPRPRRSRIP